MTDYDVFISYARQDGSAYADRLENDLMMTGLRTWRDKRTLDPHQDFSAEIEIGIRQSKAVVVCVTPSVEQNPQSFVRREILYAQSKNKPIIPLVFPDADLPVQIIHLTYIPFFAGKKPGQQIAYDTGLHELLQRLQHASEPDSRPAKSIDPFRDYLEALYDQVVSLLNWMVFSSLPHQREGALMALRSESTPDAVEKRPNAARDALPMAFFNMLGFEPDQNARTHFSDFAEAFAAFKGRLLLLGEPGAGKTTTLMAFARDAISRRLADASAPLPLFAPIATWDAEAQPPLAEWLVSVIPALQPLTLAVQQTLEGGKALLLLDGLDELGTERVDALRNQPYDPRQRFMSTLHQLPRNQVVITCRIKEYEDLVLRADQKLALEGAITLRPLDDNQVQAYLRDLPELWMALQADEGLREMARTPLLLTLFSFAFNGLDAETRALRDLSGGDLRDRIFQTYIERRYEHERRKPFAELPFMLDEIVDLLGSVAQRDVHNDFEDNVIRQQYLNELFMDGKEQQEFTELCVRLHLLVPLGEVETSRVPLRREFAYRFIHLLLRDYFAYRRTIKHFDLEDTQALVNNIRLMRKLRDKRSVPRLLSLLEDMRRAEGAARTVAFHAARTLGEIGDDSAVPALIQALDNPKVRFAAAEALGKIGDQRAVPHLIPLLDDLTVFGATSQTIASAAALALGHIGNVQAVEPLIQVLEQGDDAARVAAAEALGHIKDQRALEPLITMLIDIESPIDYIRVCEALVSLGDIAAIEPIIAGLKSDSLIKRFAATDALGRLGDQRAIQPLLESLQTGEATICAMTAEALGRIGDPVAVPTLAQLLKDKRLALTDASPTVSDYAQKALGRIGTPEALATLESARRMGIIT